MYLIKGKRAKLLKVEVDEEYKKARAIILSKINNNLLALNLYRHSDLLDGISSVLGFENDLSIDSLKDLSIVHFLIKCSKIEIHEKLKFILANIDRNTNINQVETRGFVQGSVDWNATYKRRMVSGYNDASLFICNPSLKIYDIPPNHLIRFIIEFIHTAIPMALKASPGKSKGWTIELEQLFNEIKQLRLHPRLREISIPDHLQFKTIQLTKKHRNPVYREIATLGELYYNLFHLHDKEALYSVINEQLIIPKANDKVFEFLILFEVINTFEYFRNRFGGERKITLIRAEEKTVFSYIFNKNSTSKIHVDIYYQHVPTEFKGSQYVKILKTYSVEHSKTRQPDIIIVAKHSDKTNFRNQVSGSIIEVKYSKSRIYLGEGIHDVLSYLYDFSHILNQNPKSMLAIWESNLQRPPLAEELNQDIWLTDYSNLKGSLKDFINNILEPIS